MNVQIPPRFLEQVNAIIEENLSNEDFTVTELSNGLLLSNSQVYRKIKQKTDLCPTEYVRNLRLKCAKEIIEPSDLSLSQIAFMVGFKRLSYFSTCFSTYFGYPPSSLRKKDFE